MSPTGKVKAAVLLWLAIEAGCLALVVHYLGWPGAILLGLATTLLGFFLVVRAGRETFAALRDSLSSPPEQLSPSAPLAKGLAGILLLTPGFCSDLIGLLLLSGRVRRALLNRYGTRVRADSRQTIDLAADQWRSSD